MLLPLSFTSGIKVTAIGLGRFGGQLAAIRYLAEQGADILVTDQARPETLRESIQSLSDLPQVTFQFGEHRRKDILRADLLLVSPAIAPTHDCIQLANEHSIAITTEMELFLRAARGHLLAVTGTVGKSTTASMLAHLLKAAGRNVFLGGNIGHSLLPQVNQLTADDWIVLELSSYQLHWLANLRPRFEVSLLTNLFPHHLEWHGSFEAYRQSKAVIFSGQYSADVAVIAGESLRWFEHELTAQLVVPQPRQADYCPENWSPTSKQNTAMALAAAFATGVTEQVVNDAIAHFEGLKHRQELIISNDGIRWINDSKATSPWATAAAINAQDRPFWLIVGGADNRDEPEVLFQSLYNQTLLKGICWMGPGGETWKNHWQGTIQKTVFETLVESHSQTLHESVEWCRKRAKRGDTILLSPGCPSFNEFVHYEQRGDAFRNWVPFITDDEVDKIFS